MLKNIQYFNSKKFVSGIVVTFNPDLILLKQVIFLLSQQLNFIILIDNNSDNKNLIIELFNSNPISIEYEIISLPKNVGLSAAQNIGINKARSLSATHVVLFDQDSLIEDKFIENLVESENLLISLGHQVAAVGPIFYDPKTKIDYPATLYVGPFIKKIHLNINPYIEATFIIASGCLIRLEVLAQVGLMCEELFIDYIDVEWSLRAKSLGLSVFMTKNARMAHTVGDKRINIAGRTISVHSPKRRYYLIRNSFFMLRKSYIPLGYKLREVVFNLLRFLIGLFHSNEKLIYCRFAFEGLKDGIKGRFGPY